MTEQQREREREMISGRKQPQIKSIEETEVPQKHQQFSSALGHICAGRADICDGATNIWEAATDIWKMNMPAAEGGYLDVWKQKNYLCQSLRRDVNCLSLFSQSVASCEFILERHNTLLKETSYLI